MTMEIHSMYYDQQGSPSVCRTVSIARWSAACGMSSEHFNSISCAPAACVRIAGYSTSGAVAFVSAFAASALFGLGPSTAFHT